MPDLLDNRGTFMGLSVLNILHPFPRFPIIIEGFLYFVKRKEAWMEQTNFKVLSSEHSAWKIILLESWRLFYIPLSLSQPVLSQKHTKIFFYNKEYLLVGRSANFCPYVIKRFLWSAADVCTII